MDISNVKDKIVYVASPYAGDIEKNVRYAQDACRAVLLAGAHPYAPHLYITNILLLQWGSSFLHRSIIGANKVDLNTKLRNIKLPLVGGWIHTPLCRFRIPWLARLPRPSAWVSLSDTWIWI